ncbi:MAG: SDR family oxidoreductase [Burkholderiaceae bacterium]|nr:SDR family oxidoreductase [Rhodoferax sp.]MCB2007705.1 SDR family oxidoreductase [Rhodoferax sp.]MCB2029431.1 SDR family oxidoreductase [Rhodoferax sp.]MCB2041015.1 SDR family oxidoreductase [Rhodoferax sp.]MCP5264195.1 SDR family oxidoreductase [Rhodoferax sp.]
MADKAILVTGGGSGIGRASALLLAQAGARVAVADQSLSAATETAMMIRDAGGDALALQADVSDEHSVMHMIDGTVSAFGRLDGAFNNAGIGAGRIGALPQNIAEMPMETWSRIIAVNLTGVWLCMKYELAQMQKQGHGGAIVNTASIAGLTGIPTASAYVASKHGVLGLTKTAALEYAAKHIRVNAVCPGYVETGMTEDLSAQRIAAIVDKVPMKRMGTPAEIAQLVLWLLSERASYMTGAGLTVDGGTTVG